MNKLVSIVTPVYKAEKYLEPCIKSLINQSYKNLEIILVDDGSPDNCGKICDDWAKKDERIVVIHQKNQGVSAARNSGLNTATGEYLMFLDSDDTLKTNAVEVLLRTIEKDNVDFVVGSYLKVFDNKTEVVCMGNICNVDADNKDVFYNMLKNIMAFKIWGNIYRMDIAKDIKFQVGHSWGEDFDFNLSYMLKIKKYSIIKDPLVDYNIINASSITNSSFKKKYELFLNNSENIIKKLIIMKY